MEATENRNRTNSHNDQALQGLSKMVDMGRIEFYYQFCNNSRCREITLLVLPLNRAVTSYDVQVFSQIVRQAGIPGIVLEYPDQDSPKVRMHAVTAKNIVVKDMTWNEVIVLMAQRQKAHEKVSGQSECSNYSQALQPRGTWRAKGENYRFSNEARQVPGVRHLDTDGVFYCFDCLAPVFVVEATSDGCPNTHLAGRHKNTKMTQRVARILNAEALLIQHEVGARGLKQDAYLTTYDYECYKQVQRSWDELAQFMDHSGSCSCATQAA